MRFLADMGVSSRVVEWLRANGHDAVHLREEQLHRLPNGEIFEKTAQEERIVLTFDLDFGEILAQTRGVAVPVIVFRLRNTRETHVIDRLAAKNTRPPRRMGLPGGGQPEEPPDWAEGKPPWTTWPRVTADDKVFVSAVVERFGTDED